jgi:autotransporter-associated beta strand protein
MTETPRSETPGILLRPHLPTPPPMKARHLLVTGLIVSLAVSTSHSAIYPYAEYHLGEAGSLYGDRLQPRDSSGHYRNFDHRFGNPPIVSDSASPAATGSTASLDTTTCSGYDASTFAFDLPTNNFAFGIFAQSPGYGVTYSRGNVIFSLGSEVGSLALALGPSGWQAATYPSYGGEPKFIRGQEGSFTPNTWVHLAVIRSGNVSRFYINGVDQGNPITTATKHGSPELAGNDGSPSYPFDGLIDEARVVTFSEGETTANILAALQAGAVPTAFINLGTNVVAKANLSPTEASVFRLNGGTLMDFVRVLDTDGLVVGGTAPQKHVIQISIQGLATAGRYPIIGYTGTIGGQGFAGLELGPMPPGVMATLENNIANSTIDLVVSIPASIIWTGSGSNIWDLDNTPNWVVEGGSTAVPFHNYDRVIFNDSAAATENPIAIAQAVSPAQITVDGSENYSFSGAPITGNAFLTKSGTGTLVIKNQNTITGVSSITGGTLSLGDGATSGSLGSGDIALSGGGQLVVNRNGDVQLTNRLTGSGAIRKLGPGRLFLSGSNGFSGPVTIAEGETVAASYNCFGFASSITIQEGASHECAGFSSLASVILNGNGADGKGALKNSGDPINMALGAGIRAASDASISGGYVLGNYPDGGPSRPSISGNFKLTKLGGSMIYCDETDISVKDLVIDEGLIMADSGTTISNVNPGTLTINAGGTLGFGVNYFYPISCTKPIAMNGGRIYASGGPYVNISLPSSVQLTGPGNTFFAEYTAPVFGSMGYPPPARLTLDGVVSGSGSLVMQGFGTVTLTQAPAYTGDTTLLGASSPDNPYFHGVLSLQASGLDDASAVRIVNGTLHLGFSGTDTVSKLFIDGVQQPAGVYGSGHPVGHFSGTGSLTVTTGPTGTPYQLWENSQGIMDAGPNADSDQDGISNAIEWVIGGDPSGPDSNSSALLPVITRDSTNLVFVFRRTDASFANLAPTVNYGTNFTTDWVTAEHGVNGVSIVEENDGFGTGVDKITVSIPVADETRFFTQLQVDVP